MKTEDVLNEFRAAGALLEGHFILSSGLRSPVFLQKAKVFADAVRTAKLCKALAAKVKAEMTDAPEIIVSPAVGGIVPGYEMGRQMGLPAIYVEREEGEFRLRRGFELAPGQKVLVVEDIVTTGLSSRECIDALKAAGATVLAEACLIDRSGGKADVGVPLIALASIEFPAYAPDDLPPELESIPAIKPGSRGLKA
ncbi:orotate phosphoribosyltransferase [Hyphobacterium indicum]|uniref:orotate phosphoribosyltransferase n=1 Tax=Hyphobacterium indicum TaxID=2162714 RepID=UPI000D65AB3A|nr:orotate phosphoribosyltransferase [Hyphobacterium indicum]